MARRTNKRQGSKAKPVERHTALRENAIQVELTKPGVRAWSPQLQKFLDRNRRWRERLPEDEPIYWIPENVIAELSKSVAKVGPQHRQLRSFLTKEEAQAENEFRNCCQTFSPLVVGIWWDAPVNYPLLTPANSTTVSDETMRRLGWNKLGSLSSFSADLERLEDIADGVRHQLVAYAGWLTINATYR